MKECEYEGCDRPVKSRGLCGSHARLRREGKPLRPINRYRKYVVNVPGKKVCTECAQMKDVETDFYKRADSVTPTSWCKDCMKAKEATRQAAKRSARTNSVY